MSDAVYFLVIDGSRVAELSDPRFVDMFWWEYRISAIDEKCEPVIRDSRVWESVSFSIVDADNQLPNPNTFSGGYDGFCSGLTDRLSFRSLPPPETNQKTG